MKIVSWPARRYYAKPPQFLTWFLPSGTVIEYKNRHWRLEAASKYGRNWKYWRIYIDYLPSKGPKGPAGSYHG